MNPTPLPAIVNPIEGEDFVAWTERTAEAFGLPIGVLLDKIGHPRTPNGTFTNYGVHLPPHIVGYAARVTRVPPRAIAATLLSRYHGKALDLGRIVRPENLTTTELAREWKTVWASPTKSRYCPDCLREDGTWQLHWRLATTAACTKHHVVLLDNCPGCNQPARAGAPKRGNPPYPSMVSEPTCCSNPLPNPHGTGRPFPCNFPLEEAQAWQPLWEPDGVVEHQSALNRLANGDVVTQLNGRWVPTDDFFAALRDVTGLLLALGIPEDLETVPPAAMEAFAGHVALRDRAKAKGEWSPNYRQPPATALLAAAVVPAAKDILCRPLAESLEPLILRIPGRYNWRGFLDRQDLSPAVRGPAEELLAPHAGFSRVSHYTGLTGCSLGDDHEFTADYVPHLISEDLYLNDFADLLPGTASLTGRHFAALSLTRVIGKYSWPATAVALEADTHRAARVVDVCSRVVTDPVVYWNRVHAVAAHWDDYVDFPMEVTYGERRTALSNLTEFRPGPWKKIANQLGVHPGRGDARRRSAVAYTWAETTGGDYRNAPALQARVLDGVTVEGAREHYRRFLAWAPPTLLVHLRFIGLRHAKNVTQRLSDPNDALGSDDREWGAA